MTDKISNKDNKKKLWIVILIVMIGLVLIGGTYAAVVLGLGITNGNYSLNTTCFDINYDITNDDGTMDITGTLEGTNRPTEGLSGDLSIGLDSNCSVSARGNIYLNVGADSSDASMFTKIVEAHCEDVNTLETHRETTYNECISQSNSVWVVNGTALKYAVYKVDNDKLVSSGYINTYGEAINVYGNFTLKEQTDYKVYIWLDGNLIDNSYDSLSFSGNISAEAMQIDGSVPEVPVLDAGMVPVTISEDGIVTTVLATDISSWYNYENKEWANAVLVDSSVRGSYLNTSGVEINESDILAYYVWIPRYKYEIWNLGTSGVSGEQKINILFENAEDEMALGTTIGSYRTHPAFWWDNDSDSVVDSGEMLAGIWVGKFETTGDATMPTILPNVSSLINQNLSTQFSVSQKFSANGNIYGLSNTDSHVIKNSEWGAVAYLSHSKYGINEEIRLNNNSSYTTGCGASSTNGVATSSCEIAYGSVTDNIYPQSTTGNISGVFDMSGGAMEYVMGNYNGTLGSSGFSSLPLSKYYDKYTTTTVTTACNGGVCFGHALSETSGWYTDYALFVTSDGVWQSRGGTYGDGANAGIFSFYADGNGGASSGTSWRSVLVVGY